MSTKSGICQLCGKFKRLTRGYCATKCYESLMRKGLLNKIPKKISPTTLTKQQEEILIGSLLGDGCLYKHCKNAHLVIIRKSTDAEYLKYEFEYFKNFCNQEEIKFSEIFDNRTQKTYYNCKFVTRSCPLLQLYYEKWYDKIKIIPDDLVLTPLICAIWFCDDGCILMPNKKCKRLALKLSTHGFSYEDNQKLVNLLTNELKEYFSIRYDEGNYYIAAADAGARAFIKYIEKYIPKSMNRKITWTKKQLNAPKSFSLLKNRNKYDFNEKEKAILKLLYENEKLSPKEITSKMNWICKWNSQSIPSGISLYLNRFLKLGWIEKTKIKRIKYNMTLSGINELKNKL